MSINISSSSSSRVPSGAARRGGKIYALTTCAVLLEHDGSGLDTPGCMRAYYEDAFTQVQEMHAAQS